MRNEFPDTAQRAAVCAQAYGDEKKSFQKVAGT